MRALAAVVLALIPLAGCSCDEDPNGDPNDPNNPNNPQRTATALVLTPARADLQTDGVTPLGQLFQAQLTYDDGTTEDVTNAANYLLANPSLGRMDGAEFTSNLIAGTSTVTATHGPLSARALIRIASERTIIVTPPDTPALPADPGDIFTRAPNDPARAPELVYPNDGVLVPPNLGSLETHYRPGSNNSLFELTFKSDLATLKIYTRCVQLADGCVFNADGTTWSAIAESNRGGGPVTLTVRGTDDTGTAAGASASITLHIAAKQLFGGLYYWTTSNGSGIMRVDFGAGQQTPERFFPFEGNGCYGCHALSRNGRKMSLSENGISDGRLTLIDVASRTVLLTGQDDKREQFQTWNPTSDKIAGVWADRDPPDTNIRIRDGNSGEVLEMIDIGTEPDHPDWSPLGDRILFTLVTRNEVSQRPGRGGISYIQTIPGGWSAATELVPPEDGKNRYYPAYAPDAQLFVFNESICPNNEIYNGDCDADADPSAKLHAMATNGGPRVTLQKANAPGVEDRGATDLSNTFPKWAPFVDARYADDSGRLMWLTFSSRRRYGLRAPNGSDQLLWMVAIDPDAILAGRDGSHAAFALPFQDLSTSNHIAQWTAQIVPPTNNDGGPPDQPNPSDASDCIGIGDTCNPAADLCCAGATCEENGPGIYLCRPSL